jgi:hypothetical protein
VQWSHAFCYPSRSSRKYARSPARVCQLASPSTMILALLSASNECIRVEHPPRAVEPLARSRSFAQFHIFERRRRSPQKDSDAVSITSMPRSSRFPPPCTYPDTLPLIANAHKPNRGRVANHLAHTHTRRSTPSARPSPRPDAPHAILHHAPPLCGCHDHGDPDVLGKGGGAGPDKGAKACT